VGSVKDGVQENEAVAEVEFGRVEFLRVESAAQGGVVKFREMQQGRLSAWLRDMDELEAWAVFAAGVQRYPAGEQFGYRDDRAGVRREIDA